MTGLHQLRADVRAFLDAECEAGGFVPRADNWLAGWDEAFTGRLAELADALDTDDAAVVLGFLEAATEVLHDYAQHDRED